MNKLRLILFGYTSTIPTFGLRPRNLQVEKGASRQEKITGFVLKLGKLTDLVADKRPVAQGFLYGSEPPPVDTVWEKIKGRVA